MDEERPNYYAIIPANVRYNEKLRDKAKLLYGEITALATKNGKCWASNSYFAELYGVTPETISRLIKQLKDEGYVKVRVVMDENTRQIKGRYIVLTEYLLTKKSIPIDKNVNTPIDKNVKENNTSNEYINNNNNSIVEEYEKEIGLLTPYQYEKLITYTVDLSAEMIIEAIHRASAMNKRNLSYVEGILRNWIQSGYKTLGDIKEKDKKPIKEVKKFKNDITSADLCDLYDN